MTVDCLKKFNARRKLKGAILTTMLATRNLSAVGSKAAQSNASSHHATASPSPSNRTRQTNDIAMNDVKEALADCDDEELRGECCCSFRLRWRLYWFEFDCCSLVKHRLISSARFSFLRLADWNAFLQNLRRILLCHVDSYVHMEKNLRRRFDFLFQNDQVDFSGGKVNGCFIAFWIVRSIEKCVCCVGRKQEILKVTEHLLAALMNGDYEAYSKIVDPQQTSFIPEVHGSLIEGLEFQKFYFDHGTLSCQRSTSHKLLFNRLFSKS